MRTLLLTLAMSAAFPALAAADDFWVDGQRGADLPANGRSPQTPWKTITFALANIPAPVAPATHTLHVVGGQTYAAATNGETFPSTMREGVSLVGLGERPVLAAPVASLRFPAASNFGPDVHVRDLVFRGGTVAVGGVGTEHSPAFVGCRFEDGNLQLSPGDDGRIHVRIEDCAFVGPSVLNAAVHVYVAGQCRNADVAPRVVGCEFTQWTCGVLVDHGHGAPTGTRVHVRVERCRFEGCARGVFHLLEPMGTTNRSEVSIADCSFHDSRLAGVGASGAFDGLSVEGCRFFASPGADGIALESSGSAPATLRHNVIAGGSTGIALKSAPFQTGVLPRARVEDCWIAGCWTGVEVGQSRLPAAIEVERCRLLGNSFGVRVPSLASWPANAATVAVRSTVIAGGGDGVWLDTPQLVELDGVTIADHAGAGVRVVNAGAGSRLTHCVLAGNAVDLSGTVATSYCAFQNQDVPGVGNLRVDPLLQRPTYKLHEASPCIDAGNAALALPATDYEGDPRLVAGRFGTRPDLGADEFVPAGSVHVHGLPGVGQAGFPPRMASPNRTARIGEPLDVQVRDARDATGAVAAAAALAFGVDEVVVDLTPFAAPGSLLLTTPLWVAPAVAPGPLGIGTVRFAIPSDPSLYGGVAQLQWLVLYGSTSAVPLATSDALRVTIGR